MLHKYSVALSFSGKDRALAEEIADGLVRAGETVFYDLFEEHSLWGSNLHERLQEIYTEQCKYCVMLVSDSYLDRMWTVFERQQIVDRLAKEHGSGSILPVKLDGFSGRIPGMSDGIGFIGASSLEGPRILTLLLEKLNEAKHLQPHRGTQTQLNREKGLGKNDPLPNLSEISAFIAAHRENKVPRPDKPVLVCSSLGKALALLHTAKRHNPGREELMKQHDQNSYYAMKAFGLLSDDGLIQLEGTRRDRALEDVVREKVANSPTIVCVAQFLRLLPNAVAEDVGELLEGWLDRKWVESTKAGYGSSMRQWTLWAYPDVAALVDSSVKDHSGNYSRLMGRSKRRSSVLTQEKWQRARQLFLKGLTCGKVAKDIGLPRTTLYNYQEMIKRGDPYPFQTPTASLRNKNAIPTSISEIQWIASHALLAKGYSAKEVAEFSGINRRTFEKYRARLKSEPNFPQKH